MSERQYILATKRNFYIALGVVAILVVIVAVYLILDQPPQVDAARLELDPVIGEEDAPVTIYEFGAYGCYSCRAIHQSGFNAQLEELIASEYAGQVRFVFVNFPVISANDPLSAEAAQCALDQGQDVFWSFHNGLFAVSNETYAEMRGEDDYVRFAERTGIDADALAECLDNDTHERTVDHHERRANRLNVPGTAIFYVNDRQVQPEMDAIRELIDTELAN